MLIDYTNDLTLTSFIRGGILKRNKRVCGTSISPSKVMAHIATKIKPHFIDRFYYSENMITFKMGGHMRFININRIDCWMGIQVDALALPERLYPDSNLWKYLKLSLMADRGSVIFYEEETFYD